MKLLKNNMEEIKLKHVIDNIKADNKPMEMKRLFDDIQLENIEENNKKKLIKFIKKELIKIAEELKIKTLEEGKIDL